MYAAILGEGVTDIYFNGQPNLIFIIFLFSITSCLSPSGLRRSPIFSLYICKNDVRTKNFDCLSDLCSI